MIDRAAVGLVALCEVPEELVLGATFELAAAHGTLFLQSRADIQTPCTEGVFYQYKLEYNET
jgi:hypothetical protein